MKTLVLGAGGMAGHVIALSLKEKGYAVTGLARRELSFCETVRADAANLTELKNIIKSGGFGAVINAVGILPGAISGNPGGGILINSCLPHFLAEMTENTTTKIIHLSTDCVFSGNGGGEYDESAFCSADDYYGRSKALGELNDEKNLTFRMSIVGPDINERGVGLFNWFQGQRGAVRGYTRAVWTGVTTITLARAVAAALEQGLSGLYHLVNNSSITKYELLKLFNTLKTPPNIIIPDESYKADKSMRSTRRDFQFAVPSYSDMIAGMGEWITAHRELYPHYSSGMKK